MPLPMVLTKVDVCYATADGSHQSGCLLCHCQWFSPKWMFVMPLPMVLTRVDVCYATADGSHQSGCLLCHCRWFSPKWMFVMPLPMVLTRVDVCYATADGSHQSGCLLCHCRWTRGNVILLQYWPRGKQGEVPKLWKSFGRAKECLKGRMVS